MKIVSDYFSLEKICFSGQCFRFCSLGEQKYSVVAFGKYLEMEQHGNEITFHCSQKDYNEIWFDYFDFATDYQKFYISPTDVYLNNSVEFGKGIRILKQDLWETIISFIISQQNNIKRIKKSIQLLCEQFGEKKFYQNHCYYTFPSIENLNVTEEQLKQCNLGYRSKYIVKTVQTFLNHPDLLEYLKKCDYTECKKELLKLYGVGQKVADCICLFALHHMNAFPIDTHINSILQKQYQNGFPFDLYSGYEGVIQQYLFYYDYFTKKG